MQETKTAKQKAMELLKPPFSFHAGYIFDSAKSQNTVADEGDCELGTLARLRGWGRLGYLPDGAEIQDAIGEILAEALNDFFEKHSADKIAKERAALSDWQEGLEWGE